MMRLFLLVTLFVCAATAFESFPYDAFRYQAQLNVFVDCTSGSDSTGDGSNGNPYATINQANQTPLNEYIAIFIRNGPCTESQVTIQQGYSYYGQGTTPVVVTNGFTYTSPGNDWIDNVLVNLNIGSLDIDMTIQYVEPWTNRVYNSIIQGGTITGSSNPGFITAHIHASSVQLTALNGVLELLDCTTSSLPSIGTAGSLAIVGGTYSASTTVGDNASVRVMGASVGSASFSSTSSDTAIPVYIVGSLTKGSASVSGMITITHTNDRDERIQFGSVTLSVLGSATVTLTSVYGDYLVSLEPTATTVTVPYVTGKSSTGFTVHGDANATLNYAVIKRV